MTVLFQEIDSKDLGVLPEFDTFGSTAAELARRQAAKEIGDRCELTLAKLQVPALISTI